MHSITKDSTKGSVIIPFVPQVMSSVLTLNQILRKIKLRSSLSKAVPLVLDTMNYKR